MLSTGEVAARAGVNIQTVRYYERRGLLPEPARKASGYRLYDEDFVSQIRFIKRAQELGFTLAEIQDLLALKSEAADRGEVKAQTESKIAEIDTKIRDLEKMKRTLLDLSHSCDGHGSIDDCPIWLALEGRTGDSATQDHC